MYLLTMYKPSGIHHKSNHEQLTFQYMEELVEHVVKRLCVPLGLNEPEWQYAVYVGCHQSLMGFDFNGHIHDVDGINSLYCPWDAEHTLLYGLEQLKIEINDKVESIKEANQRHIEKLLSVAKQESVDRFNEYNKRKDLRGDE